MKKLSKIIVTLLTTIALLQITSCSATNRITETAIVTSTKEVTELQQPTQEPISISTIKPSPVIVLEDSFAKKQVFTIFLQCLNM